MDQQLQLHDIHLPDDPNMWPLAIGWWILIVLAVILICLLFLKLKKYLYLKKHKRMLRNEYDVLEKKLSTAPDKSLIAETNVLLRRLALAYYPEQNIASLTGSDWLTFLDGSGNTHDFSRGAGRILIDAPYRSSQLENYNGDEFIPLIRNWVNRTINTKVNNRVIQSKKHKNSRFIGKVGGCL